ncbi:hypothetical protein Ami103574_04540 [Aminipila butyrica]|uniref:Copper amine oxidase-like N-terminal domain-containing protein n=1 Tax=Aminipila butyrica TaxID=433296 RepID=A0A858BRR1_9FIRM|nr:stalk domain-containing protein [Aminipila butyrica]QIB68631.1 hypothetical protein Ami103574_04540 [Aminipila butyrica]
MKRKLLSTILAIAVFAASASMAFAGNIGVNINGVKVDFTNDTGAAFVDNANRTQVPLRVTMEGYGCQVSWDQETQTAIVTKDSNKVEVPINQNYIIVNGNKQDIDTAAQVVNSRTYLPIRAVLEAFGASVSWDQTAQTVVIKTNTEGTVPATHVEKNTATPSVTQAEAAYVGNNGTKKYHKLDCRYVNSIKAENVAYFKTKLDATAVGYEACKVCNP